jgi:hypothetical protein
MLRVLVTTISSFRIRWAATPDIAAFLMVSTSSTRILCPLAVRIDMLVSPHKRAEAQQKR